MSSFERIQSQPMRLVGLDEDGAEIPVEHDILVVGRDPGCDARIDSMRVSRRHCCLTHSNGELMVRDLGSTNGIRINGLRVAGGRLRPGDELAIAHHRFRFESGPAQNRTLAESASGLLGLPARRGELADDENPVVAAVCRLRRQRRVRVTALSTVD
jgi:pSer/pThr/pTyr-binding forkhead associated (FHA) protein